ncbi:polysaccharide deacetylase family protein [Rhodocytophaga rosea]|uniref:Polysaccharide deacetylase family protein n=1 Tax=Rhodocytophaga rosea TaxID=2704465 RepID=A0A6C0GG16_9BACT|nr:polysaccharide deacetylase family protein [Rhodocytophaga rosea]QHT66991.1 polysaccharide deacetylase family protein [Rhodocytophaga rosea]
MKTFVICILLLLAFISKGQNSIKWPESKQALIVLTYDDALLSHLQVAIPQLNQARLKGTFFLKEPAATHINAWKEASQKGHELGNHTVYHPCLSSKFKADPHYQAENYSVDNMMREISTMNTILYAIDNKLDHTYAYPCGETSIQGKSYVDRLKKSGFVAYARAVGSSPIITDFKNLDPYQVPCMGFAINAPGSDMIEFVKQVQQNKGMGVLIFHGVGGDYLEVSAAAHQELVQYLKEHQEQIWVATFKEAMDYVTKHTK